MQHPTQTYTHEEATSYDVEKIRADFPILRRVINGKPLTYLDSAAMSQKPIQVIEAMDRYYDQYNANVFRGVYQISEEATAAYEKARRRIAEFINAIAASALLFSTKTSLSWRT